MRILLFCILLVIQQSTAHAQESAPSRERVVINFIPISGSDALPIPTKVEAPPDSVDKIIASALDTLSRAGFLYAAVDSVVNRAAREKLYVDAYINPGQQAKIEQLILLGPDERMANQLLREIKTSEGRTFSLADLEHDLTTMNEILVHQGFVDSSVELSDLRIKAADESLAVTAEIAIFTGEQLIIDRVVLPDGMKTSPSFVRKYLGLPLGVSLTEFDQNQIVDSMIRLGFIQSCAAPSILSDENGTALFLPCTEGPPGAFDVVLGYLPSAGSQGGTVVGTGSLELINLFGGGRSFSIVLDRTPGRASRVESKIADPFLIGPIGIALDFSGHQRDSTFSRQEYGLESSYRFAKFAEVLFSARRESSRPGEAGLKITGGRQAIPRTNGFLLGGGIRFDSRNRTFNPSSGVVVESRFWSGRTSERLLVVDASDTTATEIGRRQERLEILGRGFFPATSQTVFLAGFDAAVLRKDDYAESDLMRFGGSNSLRGYNEDQFLGRAVGRAFLEFRYLLDRTSNLFAFADFGFVQSPATTDGTVHVGYGFGSAYDTPVGIVKVSYAMNPNENVLAGRVHVGLAFGL